MIGFAGLAIAVVLALGGWGLAQSRDKSTGQPVRPLVRLGAFLAALGLLVGVLTLPPTLTPPTYAAGLGIVLVAGLLLVRGAAMRAVGWTAWAEAATTAAALAWARPGRASWSLLAGAGGLALAAALVERGEALAGLLGAMVMLAPARWWMRAGWRQEKARTGVERAVAGVLSGAEWDPREAADRGAPIRVKFRGNPQPVLITAPLPPNWRATAMEADRAELRERLSAWGSPWTVEMSSSGRGLTAALCEPLPNSWVIPKQRSWEWIDQHKPSPLALYLGEAQDANSGQAFPLWWDPDAGDPHALIGGKTKKGKTVGLRLLVAQAVARGWDVIIADPKGVDFVWAGRLPGVRYFPGKDCLDGLAEALGEMEERQGWLQRNLWTGGDGADEEGDLLKVPGQPYKPCLVIIDEAAEMAGLGDKDDKAQTAESQSSLARLSRFAGMVCAFATQRPDVKFLPGEAKANLGVRVLYGAAGPTLTNMVLDVPSKDLVKMTAEPRGRGRAVISEGKALEFQGGFIAPKTVKALRGVLPGDKLTRVRFSSEPAWRELVRAGKSAHQMDPATLKHPDFDKVAAELDAKIAEADAKIAEHGEESVDREQSANHENEARECASEVEPEMSRSDPTKPDLGYDFMKDFDDFDTEKE